MRFRRGWECGDSDGTIDLELGLRRDQQTAGCNHRGFPGMLESLWRDVARRIALCARTVVGGGVRAGREGDRSLEEIPDVHRG
jgi:hypothetical protein